MFGFGDYRHRSVEFLTPRSQPRASSTAQRDRRHTAAFASMTPGGISIIPATGKYSSSALRPRAWRDPTWMVQTCSRADQRRRGDAERLHGLEVDHQLVHADC
jgi:hypothetical protein